jgi:transcriptional regulator with XRE-family HTH domain
VGTNRKEQLGLRIKELRRQAGLKQEQVAEAVGIDSKSLSRIEQGKHYPSLETLESLGDALKAPLREFFDFPEDKESLEELRAILQKYVDTLSENQLRNLVRAAKEISSSPI